MGGENEKAKKVSNIYVKYITIIIKIYLDATKIRRKSQEIIFND